MIKSFGLLILRLSIGTMLIHHGYEKLADIENFADAFVRPIGLPFPIFSSYIAAYSEIYGSWLLIVGLLTRFGALAIIGTITVAIYHAIVTSGFNIYLLELLALYFSSAISIICLGPGKFSADYLINEVFINKTNPIGIKSNKSSIQSSEPSNTKKFTKKSKQDKFFEFPFSSFLSS